MMPPKGQEQEFFDRAIRFFLYVLVFWLPYSSAMIEICVIAGFVLWVLKRIVCLYRNGWKKKNIFFPTPDVLNASIAAFFIICFLSSLNSLLWDDSLKKLITKTSEWFVIYFLVIDVFKEKKHFYTFFVIWVATAVATSIDALIQYYFTYRDLFRGQIIVAGDRATASFRTPNGLGAYLIVVIPLGIMMFFDKQNTFYRKLMNGVVVLFFVWALVVASSRGAWLGLSISVAGMILFCIMQLKNFKLRMRGIQVFIGVVSVGLLVYIFYFFNPARVNTVSWRLTTWQEVLVMIKDRPFLGHGVNSFMRIFQEYRLVATSGMTFDPTYAHNCFLQLAAETGILGLSVFIFILGQFFKYIFSIWNDLSHNNSLAFCQAGLAVGIVAFLVHSFFDNNWYSLQLGVYLWLSMGMAVALTHYLKTIQERKGVA